MLSTFHLRKKIDLLALLSHSGNLKQNESIKIKCANLLAKSTSNQARNRSTSSYRTELPYHFRKHSEPRHIWCLCSVHYKHCYTDQSNEHIREKTILCTINQSTKLNKFEITLVCMLLITLVNSKRPTTRTSQENYLGHRLKEGSRHNTNEQKLDQELPIPTMN